MCACMKFVCVNRGQLPTNQLHDINVCLCEAHVLIDCELEPLYVCVCMCETVRMKLLYVYAHETRMCEMCVCVKLVSVCVLYFFPM